MTDQTHAMKQARYRDSMRRRRNHGPWWLLACVVVFGGGFVAGVLS